MLRQRFFLVIEHLQEALLLKLALYVGNFSHVGPILDEDVEASCPVAFLSELELLIVLVIGAVGN